MMAILPTISLKVIDWMDERKKLKTENLGLRLAIFSHIGLPVQAL